MSIVLGLDVGYSSLGWALINLEQESIIAMGTRIFPSGVQDMNSEKEASLAAQRRTKRLMRRQYERTSRRRKKVRNFLIKLGLLPNEEFLENIIVQDPYLLRSKAISENLELFEIGRIIDHMNSRRGFLSNRKSSSDEEASGAIYEGKSSERKAGINDIDDVLDERFRRWKLYVSVRDEYLNQPFKLDGMLTAGQYLASLNPRITRRRNRFTLRDHFRIELDLILRLQRRYHPNVLTLETIEKILATVYYQRPLKSQRHTVGKCPFEPKKHRCHKSHPEFELFRIRQQLSTLRIIGPDRLEEEDQELTETEFNKLWHYLTHNKSIDLSKPSIIKKELHLPTKVEYRFNLEKLDCATTIIKLNNALGTTFVKELGWSGIHEIWNVLNFAKDDDWVYEHFLEKGFSEEQSKELARMRLVDGHASLSLKAIRRIMEVWESGFQYNEACAQAGYKHSLPNDKTDLADQIEPLNNKLPMSPIVKRSFTEVRKVVNALIRQYGKPDIVRIELARELKKPASERAKAEKEIRANRRENEKFKAILEHDFKIFPARSADVLRYKLWRQQGQMCIYTGKSISREQLFNGPVEVDHILPYSRTLDDSQGNKVVCFKEINSQKGNLTPQEAVQAGTINGALLKARVAELLSLSAIKPGKARKLLLTPEQFAKQNETQDFISRQLNDTRYVGRLVHEHLKKVIPDVSVTNGALTSMLRKRWGLNGVIPELAKIGRAWVDEDSAPEVKDRADHRHHAIDALVVALTDRNLVNKISRMNADSNTESTYSRSQRINLPESMPGLFAMALKAVDSIVVSHRPVRPARGAMHLETVYGLAKDENGIPLTNEKGMQLYTIRKPIQSLKNSSMVRSIADKGIRTLVLTRLTALGVNINSKFEVPDNAFAEPLFQVSKDGRAHNPIFTVRILVPSSGMKKIGEQGAYVEPGSNDNIKLKWREDSPKPEWAVETTFDAVQNTSFSRSRDQIKLMINDVVAVSKDPDTFHPTILFRVQMINKADGKIVMRQISSADITNNASRLMKMPNTLFGYRVSVSPIGSISNRRQLGIDL